MGIIPAFAGSTARRYTSLRPAMDHPRIRGEHPRICGQSRVTTGSSPHSRGAHQLVVDVRPDPGIIPAFAGSTSRREPRAARTRDHPRIRGEHSRPGTSPCTRGGSSPHSRGARIDGYPRETSARIIPAFAGSTAAIPSASSSARDHPRIRGEHSTLVGVVARRPGSSPHSRGARRVGCRRYVHDGIIPAFAGSTLPRLLEDGLGQDHPRIRGEHDCHI